MSYAERIDRIMIKSMGFKDLKAWAIKHLKKQLKEEQKGLEFSKSLAIEEIFEKAVYPVGTIREWKGKKYVKVSQGKWMRKYDNAKGRGAETALKNILKKVEAAQTAEELKTIIYENLRRFKDENGKILPEVKQIYELAKKEKESTGKTSETASNIGSKGKSENSEKKEEKTKKESNDNSKTYWIQNRHGVRLTSDIAKKRIKDSLEQIKVFEKVMEDSIKNDDVATRVSASTSINLEYEKAKDLYDKLNPEDRNEFKSEMEKHKNRSDAMKGNKNAYKEKIKEIIQKLKNAKSYEESDLRKEKLQVEKDFLKNDKKGFDEYAKEQAEKKFNDLNFSKYSKEQLTDYINNTIKYNMDIMQRHIDNGNYESGMDKSDYEHAREMLKNEKSVFEDKLKEVSAKEGSSKKEELPKSNVEMTPKQKKTFDDFGKKYIKKNWPQDRIEKFSKHNYDINGEDWTITTDGRIMLCVKEKFDEPENANKVAEMRGVFDILNPKEIETPKDIDTLIKNAPKKVVVGKDYKGKDEKQNAIIKIGDRYFSVEHLKTIQDFLGPLSNVKIEADPRETNAAKFISGDKAVVAMPFRVDDENDKRIIKADSLKKSISYRVEEIFRGL